MKPIMQNFKQLLKFSRLNGTIQKAINISFSFLLTIIISNGLQIQNVSVLDGFTRPINFLIITSKLIIIRKKQMWLQTLYLVIFKGILKKNPLKVENTQIFHHLQSLLTNASLLGLNIPLFSSNLSLLYWILIFEIYI